jgi:hypothetical protein
MSEREVDLEVLEMLGVRPVWVDDLRADALILTKRGLVLIETLIDDAGLHEIVEAVEREIMATA